MQAKVEKQKNNKVKLNITVSKEEMTPYFQSAYEKMAPSVTIQGFRAGKAPRKLIEAEIGITRIMSEALDMAVNENYIKALEENKLQPVSSPSIAISKYPLYGQTAEAVKDDFEFTMEIEVFPEVSLGNYSKLKIELPKKDEVKLEDTEKVMTELRRRKASFSDLDGAAKIGDLAEISFAGMVKKVPIDSMTSKNHPVILGENTLIPGFEENIVGMKKGEKKSFKIKFPKDYHAKEFAGKEAEFSVELIGLKEVKLPELDDLFAADFGQPNIDALKKAIKKNVEDEAETHYQAELENRAIDKVLPLLKVEIPVTMIDREVERMIEGYSQRLAEMKVSFESYLESMKKSAEELKKEMRPQAEKNIKVGLLLGKIIEEQKIDHHDQEAGKKAIQYLVKELTK